MERAPRGPRPLDASDVVNPLFTASGRQVPASTSALAPMAATASVAISETTPGRRYHDDALRVLSLDASLASRPDSSRTSSSTCRALGHAWWAAEGFSGIAIVVILLVIIIYLVAIIVLHCVGEIADELVEELRALVWVDVNVPISVIVGISGIILLCCATWVLARATCRWGRTVRDLARDKDRYLLQRTRSRNSLVRVSYFWKAWLGGTGPAFQRLEFLREAVELALQVVALHEFTTQGVSRGFLAGYAFIIALNLVTPVLLATGGTALRSATIARHVLVLDAGCDTLYALWPICYMLYFMHEIFGTEAGRDAYCPRSPDGNPLFSTSDCNEVLAYQLTGIATEAMFGGRDFYSVAIKLVTRLLPILFAIGRLEEAILLPKLVRLRLSSSASATAAASTTAASAGGEVELAPVPVQPISSYAASSVTSSKGESSKSMQSQRNNARQSSRDKRRRTSLLSRRPNSQRELLANDDYYYSVPKWATALLVLSISSTCLWVWIRLLTLGECKVEPLKMREKGGFCLQRASPVFDLSLGVECSCSSVLLPPNGTSCGENNTLAEQMYSSLLDAKATAAWEYTRDVTSYSTSCSFNSTHVAALVEKSRGLRLFMMKVGAKEASPPLDLGEIDKAGSSLRVLDLKYQNIVGLQNPAALQKLNNLLLLEYAGNVDDNDGQIPWEAVSRMPSLLNLKWVIGHAERGSREGKIAPSVEKLYGLIYLLIEGMGIKVSVKRAFFSLQGIFVQAFGRVCGFYFL